MISQLEATGELEKEQEEIEMEIKESQKIIYEKSQLISGTKSYLIDKVSESKERNSSDKSGYYFSMI